jgi:hypothetical protein
VFGGVLGIIATLFVLVQQGLLQLSGWSGLAWVVLAIFAAMFALLIIIGFSVYVTGVIAHGAESMFNWLLKKEPPKRAFPLRVIDKFMGILFKTVVAVAGWLSEQKENNTPIPQYTGDHASFKEIFDTITDKATDPNARQE